MAAITCKSMETSNFHLSFVATFLQMGVYGSILRNALFGLIQLQ